MEFSTARRYQSANVLATLAINRAEAISPLVAAPPGGFPLELFERKAAPDLIRGELRLGEESASR
jgi:hypothetical protein